MVPSFALLVAAIDIGTTNSGWGFSFRHDFEIEPANVYTKIWRDGRQSYKGPTSILIKSGGRSLHSFGYEAEKDYADLVARQEHNDWFLFQQFKAKLNEVERFTEGMVLQDIVNKSLAAKTVLSLSIKYLKDDLIESLQGCNHGIQRIQEHWIHWVLTVPAVWNEAQKEFMREVAQEAGISTDNLTIALEPDAASLYCHHVAVDTISGRQANMSTSETGKRYIVADLGGGTADFNVHEVLSEGKHKQLYTASYRSLGGSTLDQGFVNFLADIVGPDVMIEFKTRYVDDYMDLLREFEVLKWIARPSKDYITLTIPNTFVDLCQIKSNMTMKNLIDKSSYSKQVEQNGDKLQLEASVVEVFFKKTIDDIVDQLKSVLLEPVYNTITEILMVGGFSESDMLQEAIKSNFSSHDIIIPAEAGLAVLKGAVIFGHFKMMSENLQH